jgi:hypothetical protein
MRKALYLYALVVVSACGSGRGQLVLLDAAVDDADVVGDPGDATDATDATGASDAGGTTDGGFVQCNRVMFSTASPPSYPTGMSPSSVAVADVNHDGKPDLVVANGDSATISALLGNGDGTFKDKLDAATGMSPAAVTVADVSKDGIPDVIVANRGSGTVSVLVGKGDGTFKPKVDLTTNPLPTALAVADVDGDGKLDIVVANGNSDVAGAASVFLGNGNGTFKNRVDLATGGFPGAIAVADVNKDGKLDIVVTSGTDSVASVLLGNGNGTFKIRVDYALGLPGMAVVTALAVVDVNRDGKLDILAADTAANRAWVLLNKGDGTFPDKVGYTVGARPQSLAARPRNRGPRRQYDERAGRQRRRHVPGQGRLSRGDRGGRARGGRRQRRRRARHRRRRPGLRHGDRAARAVCALTGADRSG